MQIKTFRALDMREALRMVKAELGPDAVILSSHEVKKAAGAFGLFSRTVVEVTAAVDQSSVPHPRPGNGSSEMGAWNKDVREDRAAILSHGRLTEGQRGEIGTHHEGPRSDTPSLPPVKSVRSFSDHMEGATEFQSVRAELTQIKHELSGLRDVMGPMAAARDAWTGFEDDVRSMQCLVGTLLNNEREQFVHRLPVVVRAAYERLRATGIDMAVVLDLITQLHELNPLTEEQVTATLHTLLSRQVAQSVRCVGALLESTGGPPALAKVVMIVGPTGVGKTTTIAKLAAQAALQHKRKVALITLDTYRVAAVEQLRVYGNILGLAVDVALTCEDLAGLLRARQDADLILIDTAGRSPLDQSAFRELKKLVALNRQVEAHLVLSAATRESDLTLVLPRFASLPVKSLIFSKLDETTQYGMIFTILHRSCLPLSYVSTGQRVPEDLTVATPTLLTDLLLNGSSVIKTLSKEIAAPAAPPQNAPRPRPLLGAPSGSAVTQIGQASGNSWPPSTDTPPGKSLLGALSRALTIRAAKK